jgi:carboxymethylenebutenolidase
MERKVASDYPQELLDLFHEYQHGDISRRTFLDRAGKFAVGGLTVAAIFVSLILIPLVDGATVYHP